MLPPRAQAYLYDLLRAARLLGEFTSGVTYAAYTDDALLRSAVERQFIIIGEALNQLSRVAPEIAEGVHEAARIISFRNILVHGYAVVDQRVVWGVLQRDLPMLRRQVENLLGESGPRTG